MYLHFPPTPSSNCFTNDYPTSVAKKDPVVFQVLARRWVLLAPRSCTKLYNTFRTLIQYFCRYFSPRSLSSRLWPSRWLKLPSAAPLCQPKIPLAGKVAPPPDLAHSHYRPATNSLPKFLHPQNLPFFHFFLPFS